MKIGIPRALLYYYYYPFWKIFFEELGQEVIVSEPTSKKLINNGTKHSISEICVPIKVFIGHLLDLLDKKVDLIYVPRFVSIKKDITFCPKFLGLPDMVKHSLEGFENKILINYIETKSDNICNYKNYLDFTNIFNISKGKLKKAARSAEKYWHEFREKEKEGFTADQIMTDEIKDYDGDITIGLVGYVYNIYDKYISMDLLNRLREMGVKILTFEMFDVGLLEDKLGKKKRMFWEFTNRLQGAGYNFIHSPEVDGVIHVTAFGCGPDSILGPFLDNEAGNYNKPLLRIRIDEQTGVSHFITRIEAFIDMIKLKKMA